MSTDLLNIELIGFVAACLTSASFLPQAIMVIRTRKTDGLSLGMYLMFTLGVALWLAYGVATIAWPLIFANLITFTLAGCILTILLQNKWTEGQPRRAAKTRRKRMRAGHALAA